MPGPLGIVKVNLTPLTLDTGTSFTDSLNQTMPNAEQTLQNIAHALDTANTIQNIMESDFPNMEADISAIDDAMSTIDTLEWGSPEPDLQAPTDYLEAKRADSLTTASQITGPPPIPMVYPDGQGTMTIGGPPEYGGTVKVGYPQYALHLPVAFAGPGVRGVSIDHVDGPNPPFIAANYGVIQETIGGVLRYVALVAVNPSRVGTFNGVLYYNLDASITGFSGVFKRTFAFQVVVQR